MAIVLQCSPSIIIESHANDKVRERALRPSNGQENQS